MNGVYLEVNAKPRVIFIVWQKSTSTVSAVSDPVKNSFFFLSGPVMHRRSKSLLDFCFAFSQNRAKPN